MFYQGSGQCDPLTLTARQLIWHACFKRIKMNLRQGGIDPFVDFFARHFVHLKPIGNVIGNGHMREHRVGLKHHVNRTFVWWCLRHILSIDNQATFSRYLEAGDNAQQRRLATT